MNEAQWALWIGAVILTRLFVPVLLQNLCPDKRSARAAKAD